jgi:hypothetical protein
VLASSFSPIGDEINRWKVEAASGRRQPSVWPGVTPQRGYVAAAMAPELAPDCAGRRDTSLASRPETPSPSPAPAGHFLPWGAYSARSCPAAQSPAPTSPRVLAATARAI